jgi:methylthioribose-1-phosphate isomerase
MITSALKWIGDSDGVLELVDQRLLPGRFEKLRCTDVTQLYEAIRSLAVRGAPAIGVAAGFGMVLGLQKLPADSTIANAMHNLDQSGKFLASSRPTAINLFFAINRITDLAKDYAAAHPDASVQAFRDYVFSQADAIYQQDVDMCRRIGQNGLCFIPDNAGILTHCNAGALATAGQGTALSVLFEAKAAGRAFKVYADETRPLLQGSRLTAWELRHAGIDTTVICDNMAGWLMKQGAVNLVITGADRIAANGDTANKIGTYSLSLLAKAHKIPFYIAAPSSTFDLSIASGKEIPIEQRAADEVTHAGGTRTAPDGVAVCNPAFDVTDAHNISAIITESGVIEKPTAARIAAHFRQTRK